MKTQNLVRKYGWEIMVYLSNLGVNLLADANLYFVDSGATNTLDSADGQHGNSFEYPFATIDYAIGQCTASQGDVVLVAPGHAETIGSATGCVLDIIGVSVIGVGQGTLRPTLSIGTATTATISITAANCRLSNLRIISSLANVAAGITIGASADGTIIENCDIRDGNAAALEMVIGISVAADADDIIIRNNTFSTVPAGGCANAIKWAGGCDRAQVYGNTAYGTYSAGCFLASTAPSQEIVIRDNIFANEGAVAIALHATCTGLLARNLLGGTTSMAAALTGTDTMWCWENYPTGAVNASGLILPAVDGD
jgi:hypothetical protein